MSRAWKAQPGSVTRFLQGQESQNPDLKKAVTLAKMLDITVEELANGLGIFGAVIEPSVPKTDNPKAIPLGTISTDFPRPGAVRLLMHRDISPRAYAQITEALANEPVDPSTVSLPEPSRQPRQ